MRKLLFLAIAGATFSVVPLAQQEGAVVGALTLVAFGCALAMAASGERCALAAAGGALGAFASGVLAAVSPAAAGAALAGLCFAERTTRVRSQSTRVLHVGASVVAGAIAGTLTASFGSAALSVQAVSVVVASVLLALPLLLDADDPVAHRLDQAGALVDDPAQKSLREAAALRRSLDEDVIDAAEHRRMKRTWEGLERLASARVRLERARAKRADGSERAKQVTELVDRRIADHVTALTRAYSAVDAARAAEAGVDDAALRDAESVGDDLEEVSRVLVEDT